MHNELVLAARFARRGEVYLPKWERDRLPDDELSALNEAAVRIRLERKLAPLALVAEVQALTRRVKSLERALKRLDDERAGLTARHLALEKLIKER